MKKLFQKGNRNFFSFLVLTLLCLSSIAYAESYDTLLLLGSHDKSEAQTRVDGAYQLLLQHSFNQIVISGGCVTKTALTKDLICPHDCSASCTEASKMKEMLIAKDSGLASKIILEDKSTSTVANYEKSKTVVGNKVVVVSRHEHAKAVSYCLKYSDQKDAYYYLVGSSTQPQVIPQDTTYDYGGLVANCKKTAPTTSNKILMIGDSHSAHYYYGKHLHSLIRTAGFKVESYGIGATTSKSWFSGVKGTDALISSVYLNEQGTVTTLSSQKTYTLQNLKNSYSPNIVIISLGTNAIGKSDSHYTTYVGPLAKIASTNAKCYWVGPPKNKREGMLDFQTTSNKIKAEVEKNGCSFIDSISLSNDALLSSDRIHYSKAGGEDWAQKVFSQLNLNGAAVTSSVPGISPSSYTSGTPIVSAAGQQYTTQKVEKVVPQRQKEIDLAWQKIAPNVDNSKNNSVWDNTLGAWDWRSFDKVYFELKQTATGSMPVAPGTTGAMTGYPGQPSAGLPINLGDCQITKPTANSQSVGNLLQGSLINGMKTETNSFVNLYNSAYSFDKKQNANTEYGVSELINMLEYSSCALNKKYNVKLTVKDRSLPTGGPTYKGQDKATQMPPPQWYGLVGADKSKRYSYTRHTTHLTGRDADLGMYFIKNGNLVNTLSTAPCKSKTCDSSHLPTSEFKDQKALAANWDLLKFMDSFFPLQYVGFDKYLIKEIHQFACTTEGESSAVKRFFRNCNVPSVINGNSYSNTLIRHINGHADHYHIAILCPKGDSQCSGNKGELKLPQSTSVPTGTTPTGAAISGNLNKASSDVSGVNFYTYNTACTSKVDQKVGRTEGIIVPENLGPNTELIIYFHGHQLLSAEADIQKRDFLDKTLELKQKGKDAVLVWFKGGNKHISSTKTISSGPYQGQAGDSGRNWMKGTREGTSESQFKCFYNEALAKLNGLNVQPKSMSFMVHSNGGGTVMDVLSGPFMNEPHLPISSVIFYDACYGSWCTQVASIPSNQRGHIFAYYYPGSKDTPQATEQIRGKDSVIVKKAPNSHTYVPTNCFVDHLSNQQLSPLCVS